MMQVGGAGKRRLRGGKGAVGEFDKDTLLGGLLILKRGVIRTTTKHQYK